MLVGGSALAQAKETVVLKGGARIEISSPMMPKGNVVILTRTDGTVFSVPASEIDTAATAALKAAPPVAPPAPAVTPPPATPAEAARAGREVPKARVRLTDADVGHNPEPVAGREGGAEKKKPSRPVPAKVEVGDYNQQKAGDQLVIHGVLRNVGASPATNMRITVAAINEKGETIAISEGSLSTGSIDPGQQTDFSVSIPVGQNTVASLRFSPQWTPTPPPAPEGAPRPAARPASSSASMEAGPAPAAPAPTPIPYGQGWLYAPPPASASMTPPTDGKTGYIPGAARKEDQPKPPQ
jgi:hypothetical protein